MKDLITQHFDLIPKEIKKLDGYDNLNYRVTTSDGSYVFKTYPNDLEMLALVKAENEILIALKKANDQSFPFPIAFKDESLVRILPIDGEERICRMLSFLDGDFLGDVKHSKGLFLSFGAFVAEMNRVLLPLSNHVIQSRHWEWNISDLELTREFIPYIADPGRRAKVEYLFLQYSEHVAPALPLLRKSIIHNDANEWNVLVQEEKISGIIDFGDLAYAPLINELAVTLTYACYDKEHPLEWAKPIIKSYHNILPLEEKEIEILYYLIGARLSISVCNSARSAKENPDNAYATSSEENAWKMIDRWLTIGSIQAENAFRTAVDLPAKAAKDTNHILEERHKSISPILSISYKEPIYMEKAAFQYMYDAFGNSFLDAYNNIPHVGHSHPKVVEAAQRQMARLNTNTRYLYDALNTYAEKLLSKFPDSLSRVFFVNSGSAASDLAIRLARVHTALQNFMVMEHGYHGNTQLGIDISDYKFSHQAGQGQKSHIIKASIPDTYQGHHSGDDAGVLYAKEAIEQLEHHDPVAAFISEPIVGCGGQVPLAEGYLKTLYPEIRKQGGVCISDEVQTGFGRLGDHFWGFEAHEVVPDIVILGKPMGNGHPIGAVVTTNEIAESFNTGVEFFSSFGGNPVSCEIGMAVLNVLEEEQLQEQARITGNHYKSLLKELQKEFPAIGDVRGSGLFLGVELVKDSETKEPDTGLAQSLKNELRNRHILVSTDGPFDNVIKSKPPLCFTKANTEQVVEEMRKILASQDL